MVSQSLRQLLLIFIVICTMNMKVTHSYCCGIGSVLSKIDDIKDKIDDIFTGVTVDIPDDIDGVVDDVDSVMTKVDDVITEIEDVPDSVKSMLTESFNTVDSAISSAKDNIMDLVEDAKTTITDSVSQAQTTITDEVASTIDTVQSSIDTAKNTVTDAIDIATDTVTDNIDLATETVQTNINTATSTIEDSIELAVTDISNEITNAFEAWFTEFTQAIEAVDDTFENLDDDIETNLNALKSVFKSLANVFGKTFDETDYALGVFLKAVLDSSSLPDDWIGALPDIIVIVEDAKNSLFGVDFDSIMPATRRRRRNMLKNEEYIQRRMLDTEAIIEWDGRNIDIESMEWMNTGSLSDDKYNVDLYTYGDLVSANDLQCDAVCFNPETASDSDQCIEIDLDITENNYESLSIDLYLYQRAISSKSNEGTIFSAGDEEERGIFMHHRSFDPDGFDQGIAIGTDSKWEGHEPLVDGTWNRVVAVWNGSSEQATLYVNDDAAITENVDRLDNDRDYFCLNAEPNKEDKNYWDGCIRRARIYDYALTVDEIAETKDEDMLINCTCAPTKSPTKNPSQSPTKVPTKAPTKNPTNAPTTSPTKAPSASPSNAPSTPPTAAPTWSPTTATEGCVDDGNRMCSTNEAVYSLGSNYKGYINNLLQVSELLPSSVGWKSAREIYTDGDVYISFQTSLTVLSALKGYVDIANEVINECITIDEVKCPFAVQSIGILGGILDTAIWVLEMFKDAADTHDGVLLTTQMDKVFKDQDVIINNQQMMYNKLEEIMSMNDDVAAHHIEPVLVNDQNKENIHLNGEYFQIAQDIYNACYHIPKELVWVSFVVIIVSIVCNVILFLKLIATNTYGKVQIQYDE